MQTLKKMMIEKQNSSSEEFLILCEPEEMLKESYGKIIEGMGLKYIWAEGGLELYKELCRTKCKVLILEMLMSYVNGMEVLEMLKKDLKLKFPIIVFTNLSSQKAKDEAFSLGANEYLIKTETDSKILEETILKYSMP